MSDDQMLNPYHYQLQTPHNPEINQIGDCWRTSIACILGIDKNKLPPVSLDQDWKSMKADVRDCIHSLGFELITFSVDSPDISFLTNDFFTCPDAKYVLTGREEGAVNNHSCVYRNDKLFHNPLGSANELKVAALCEDESLAYIFNFVVKS